MAKVTVNLQDDILRALKELAERRGITVTEALRRAIATEAFFDQETRERGNKLLLEDENHNIREVVLR